MEEKRKYPRFPCKLKVKFNYFEGNPDEIDINTDSSQKGKGIVLDISRGGVFIVTKERMAIGMPIISQLKTKKQKLKVPGKIVRTGLLQNNPSEMARKFGKFNNLGDSYIAIEFTQPIDLQEEEV